MVPFGGLPPPPPPLVLLHLGRPLPIPGPATVAPSATPATEAAGGPQQWGSLLGQEFNPGQLWRSVLPFGVRPLAGLGGGGVGVNVPPLVASSGQPYLWRLHTLVYRTHILSVFFSAGQDEREQASLVVKSLRTSKYAVGLGMHQCLAGIHGQQNPCRRYLLEVHVPQKSV